MNQETHALLIEIQTLLKLTTTDAALVKNLPELRQKVNLLEYVSTVRQGITAPVREIVYHVRCGSPGCSRTSAEADACLLNFAPKGSPVPLWYCRDHHPKGETQAVGYVRPQSEEDKLRAERKTALEKLTGSERTLVNRNMV